MIGVIIGLGYYLASETLANSGQVFNLNPIFVTWLPSVALTAITLGCKVAAGRFAGRE